MITVTIDRPIGFVHHNTTYPVNYGFAPGVLGGDGEFQDAYILGVTSPIVSFRGHVIAIIHRNDDNETKWVVAEDFGIFSKKDIFEQTQFMEQYFDSYIEMIDEEIENETKI